MLQRSPIIRFALEVFQHALDCYCSNKPRDSKIAVLHLAQAIELAVKAALVESNVSIYEKNGRTITNHDSLEKLAKLWGREKINNHARIELLIDDRNAIQHRYGSVDDVTLDYYMQTAFEVFDQVMKKNFDTEFRDWIQDNVEKEIWERVRFVSGEENAGEPPSSALIEHRSPTLDLIDGFSRYEQNIRGKFGSLLDIETFYGSTLDVIIKSLSNISKPPKDLIQKIPIAYRLRNRVIHGDADAPIEEVKDALATLDKVLNLIDKIPHDTLARAVNASARNIRGTILPPIEQIVPITPTGNFDEGQGKDATED